MSFFSLSYLCTLTNRLCFCDFSYLCPFVQHFRRVKFCLFLDYSQSSHQICGQRLTCAGSSALWQKCSSVWPNLNQRGEALDRQGIGETKTFNILWIKTISAPDCSSYRGTALRNMQASFYFSQKLWYTEPNRWSQSGGQTLVRVSLWKEFHFLKLAKKKLFIFVVCPVLVQ